VKILKKDEMRVKRRNQIN